jgi:hypothetical protein
MAFTVHFAVLNNTSWFSAYWNGSAPAKASLMNGTAPAVAQVKQGEPAFVINVAPSAGDGSTPASFVVTVTPTQEKPTGPLALAAPPAR